MSYLYSGGVGSARSRGRKRHRKSRRHLPPAQVSVDLGRPEISPFTPMGIVRGYGDFARGLKRRLDRRPRREARFPVVVIAYALVAAAAIAASIAVFR